MNKIGQKHLKIILWTKIFLVKDLKYNYRNGLKIDFILLIRKTFQTIQKWLARKMINKWVSFERTEE